jgi:hypothetical protein
MPEPLTRTAWTCARCEVTASWMADVERPELPEGWTELDGVFFCLGCRRELAGEEAVAAAPEDGTLDDQRKLRSAARIEFELRRDPAGVDGRIASACHTSVAAVRKARLRLGVGRPTG